MMHNILLLRFEVSVGMGDNRRVTMEMANAPRGKRDASPKRTARAAFTSPEFGDFDFQFGQGKQNSVIV